MSNQPIIPNGVREIPRNYPYNTIPRDGKMFCLFACFPTRLMPSDVIKWSILFDIATSLTVILACVVFFLFGKDHTWLVVSGIVGFVNCLIWIILQLIVWRKYQEFYMNGKLFCFLRFFGWIKIITGVIMMINSSRGFSKYQLYLVTAYGGAIGKDHEGMLANTWIVHNYARGMGSYTETQIICEQLCFIYICGVVASSYQVLIGCFLLQAVNQLYNDCKQHQVEVLTVQNKIQKRSSMMSNSNQFQECIQQLQAQNHEIEVDEEYKRNFFYI